MRTQRTLNPKMAKKTKHDILHGNYPLAGHHTSDCRDCMLKKGCDHVQNKVYLIGVGFKLSCPFGWRWDE